MNKRRIRALARHIVDLEWGDYNGTFNMARTTHVCGAPACIAGWAVYLFGDVETLDDNSHVVMREAQRLLDLGPMMARELFMPEVRDDDDECYVADCDAEPENYGFIDAHRASLVLVELANTGKLDWSIR